jgi:intracellular sulfur oxidation DsrE/DsrF family protein
MSAQATPGVRCLASLAGATEQTCSLAQGRAQQSPECCHRAYVSGGLDMPTAEKPLHIDIPVKLSDVNIVFGISSLAFEGDLPASLFHVDLIKNDIDDWKAKSDIVVVFHTNAGHVTLHDSAYNTDRNIATGNPYKELVAALQKRGVRVELCGATARVHNWGNADLLPNIKVNTDAMSRLTQLVQEGFVQITE